MAIQTVYSKLLDKTLEGVRIIDMGSTKPCECFVLPRDREAEVGKSYPRLQQYGFYILLGKEGNKPKAYIGQTYDFTHRAIDHKQKKEFWDKALVFVSKMNDIYASEAKYLEYLGLKAAKEADRYIIDNTQAIKEPPLSIDKKNDMELFFEDIVFLARFYGCNVFDKQEEEIPNIPPCPDKLPNTAPLKIVKQPVENKVSTAWLLPYNKKFFDLDGCYEKYGEVYWTMHCNLNPGDYGYIYGSSPESAIRFSFRVIDSDLEYNPAMDQDNEFAKKPGVTNKAEKDRRFARIKLTGKTSNDSLSLSNLKEHGLKSAPFGAMKLSSKQDLLKYIEENF